MWVEWGKEGEAGRGESCGLELHDKTEMLHYLQAALKTQCLIELCACPRSYDYMMRD